MRSNRLLQRRHFLALALAGVCALPVQAGDAKVYQFSPVNQFGLQLTASYWNPILDYIAEKSGVRMQLKIGRTSADTTSYVLAQEVDFAFTNHLFSDERRKLGWKLLARRDYPALHGVIVVPANSPIKELGQLADTDVAFPGPEAFVAYKTTYAQLLNRNVPVRVVFGGNHDGAFAQLFSGKVKAVGANEQLVEGYAQREKVGFRTLWRSKPFNDLAVMVSPRVPAADVKAVTQALLGMGSDPKGQAVIRQVSEAVKLPPFAKFIAVGDADYASYYDFYKSAPIALH